MARDRLGGKKTLKVSGFLDEFEKDDLKKKVDIVSLFECFGVKLTRKGKSYTGLCPWHDDNNPSLSVDREKGLYNCFGCGESGDVFDLVEKMKGFNFPEALEYLKDWAGEIKASSSRTKPAKKRKASPDRPEAELSSSSPAPPQKTLPASIPQDEPFPDLTLDTVASYYHKHLYGSKEASSYLEKRGLKRPELFKRFELGFADGSLISKTSNGQKEKLKSLGVFRENGGEHLHNCITVPLQDERGGTIGLYGRKIKDNGSLRHLYLKGPRRGVFNRKASRVYEQIILTESILDALSLIALGLENVQALYGTNGLTEEHLEVLKADRVKTLVLALDNDEAGKKASGALKEQLLEEGFAVKVIVPLKGKDWNDSLISGASKDELEALIEEAEAA